MSTLTRRLAAVALSLVSIPGFFVATAPAAEAATACVDQVFGYSLTKKACVIPLQRMVNLAYAESASDLGGRRQLDVDGKYGSATQSAVRNIQKHMWLIRFTDGRHITATVDGLTGVQMWSLLCDMAFVYEPATYDKAGCDSLNHTYVLAYIQSQTHG